MLRVEGLRTVVACWAAVSVLAGCIDNPYVVGELFPRDAAALGPGEDGGDAGVARPETLVVDLTHSGASQLDRTIEAGVSAALVYEGAGAGASAWPAAVGPPLARVSSGGVELVVEAPFTDATRAVRLGAGEVHYRAGQPATGELGGASAVIELVFRSRGAGTLVEKPGAWRVAIEEGRLVGVVEDGARTLRARSIELGRDAWHACWVFLDRSVGELEVLCNAQRGEVVDARGLGAVVRGAALEVGGAERLSLAHLALYLGGADQGWGDRGALAARRFFALTGALPSWARGAPLPDVAVRASVAMLELARDPRGPRHLHRVGPHWPRVACRTDADGALGCGYLGEGARRAWLTARTPDAWSGEALAVEPDPRPFLDGEPSLWALRPTTSSAAHALVHTQSGAADQYSFSVFAVTGSSGWIGLSMDGGPVSRCDLRAVAAVGEGAYAEDWGGGFVRCIRVGALGGGAHRFVVHALGPGGEERWAGAGVAASIAGLEVLPNRAYPASPLADDAVEADRLRFTARGNVPDGPEAEVRFQVLHPAAPRRNDGTLLRLSREAAPAAQLDLFVSAGGDLHTTASRGGASLWGFGFGAVPLADRRWHEVRVRWSEGGLSIDVDGVREDHDRVEGAGAHRDADALSVGQGTGSAESLLRSVVISP